jgi:chitodextrinase
MKRATAIVFGIVLGILTLGDSAESQAIYWKKDYIRDSTGVAIAVATPAPSDSVRPAPPSTISIDSTTSTQATLSWQAAADEMNGSGLAGYLIYRGAVPVGAVSYSSTTFIDSGLLPSSSYAYRIVAFDNARNYSEYSETKVAHTGANPGSPTSLVATASSTAQIGLTWTAPAGGAHRYRIWRRSNGAFTERGTSFSNSFTDNAVGAATAYLYKVAAENESGTVLGWSNIDLATTIIFADDNIAVGTTVIKELHVTQLRTAINAVRAAAGLNPTTWTNGSLAGAWIRAVDIQELRTRLDDALNPLALAVPDYTDPVLTPLQATIRKDHIQQLRDRVK